MLRRRLRQIINDRTLRLWLLGRILLRWPGRQSYKPRPPPYVSQYLPLPLGKPTTNYKSLKILPATEGITIALPGDEVLLMPGDEHELFKRKYDDLEVFLAAHRFAWLPVSTVHINPGWVEALWNAWMTGFGKPDESWSWHPYTATERAINILEFMRYHGVPGEKSRTLTTLASHIPAICAALEYHGDQYTGNHLSNNGRGLYRLGLELNLTPAADLGAEILLKEAERLFLRSGVLREGSSHYHLLLTRNYLDVTLVARRFERPEYIKFEKIARKILAVASFLRLGGGFPLIGDISPDVPPDHLMCLAGIEAGGDWLSRLSDDEREYVISLMGDIVDRKILARDGWLRSDHEAWSGLWYASPQGWSPLPGHGHQDFGGFELHFKDEPVFVDAGRGSYGEEGDSALYRSGSVHNILLIDGEDPYPPNKPYYNDLFRQHISGKISSIYADSQIFLEHNGYTRLSGVGTVKRCFKPSASGWEIISQVSGSGQHTISQYFVTPHKVKIIGKEALITGKRSYQLRADQPWRILPVTLWQAYGVGVPGTKIVLEETVKLPFISNIWLRVI